VRFDQICFAFHYPIPVVQKEAQNTGAIKYFPMFSLDLQDMLLPASSIAYLPKLQGTKTAGNTNGKVENPWSRPPYLDFYYSIRGSQCIGEAHGVSTADLQMHIRVAGEPGNQHQCRKYRVKTAQMKTNRIHFIRSLPKLI
jgi:hypothetical protein